MSFKISYALILVLVVLGSSAPLNEQLSEGLSVQGNGMLSMTQDGLMGEMLSEPMQLNVRNARSAYYAPSKGYGSSYNSYDRNDYGYKKRCGQYDYNCKSSGSYPSYSSYDSNPSYSSYSSYSGYPSYSGYSY